MSGMKRYSWSPDFMEWWDDGDYVLFSDHEAEISSWKKAAALSMKHADERLEEIARLRAELDNAAAAAVANMSLACQKEREADALRAKCDELSILHVAAVQDKAHLEIKYRNACARADAKHSGQKLVGYRWRHSAGEKWQFSDIPCGWEYEPLYAAIGADA